MAQASSNPFLVQIIEPLPPEAISFQLVSPKGGTDLPFTIGYGFRKGDFPSGTTLTTDAAGTQVVVKRRWNDGSAKHAIVSGAVSLDAGNPKTLTISSGTGSSSAALTSADIQAAAPGATLRCTGIGTVNLTDLLGSPFRTWISGPEMVECHYRAKVGTDPTLEGWFHVRLWRSGRVWIRAICENGRVDVTTSDRSYVPQVAIGSSTVYDNGGATIAHYRNTRWSVEGWIGGDPDITPTHNTTYAISTKLVPNYWKRSPSSTYLASLNETYTPMSKVAQEPNMGDTGYQPPIGLLPLWDALYCTSGDGHAWRAMMANSSALNSYGIVWRDSSTRRVPRPSDWSTYSIDGGVASIGRGSLTWELNHAPSAGYTPYLFSGDYWHYETMLMQAATIYLSTSNYSRGSGTQRLLTSQPRGTAWNLRTVGQACALAPEDDPVLSDYQALLAYQYEHWLGVRNRPGINQLGGLYAYEMGHWGHPGSVPAWETDFWIAINGFLSEVDPLSSLTQLIETRDWMYRWVVGRLGAEGTDQYCYAYAARYTINVNTVSNNDPTTWFDSWGDVFRETVGSDNTSCPDSLQGNSGADPSAAPEQGYWGALLPAIAYAVDHSAAGASQSWARLTGATNWSTIETSGFDNTPTWGIVPRGYGAT